MSSWDQYQSTQKIATRNGFGDGLLEAARKNPKVVALCADLAGSLKMDLLEKEFPERFFQIGVAEANMMGMASGMATCGLIPYTGTFANFSTGRVYDQIRQSIAYSGKNVKICASHAGLTLGEDGATHQILEDIGLMKMLPGMCVINPADYAQTKAAAMAIADYQVLSICVLAGQTGPYSPVVCLLKLERQSNLKREAMSVFLPQVTCSGRLWKPSACLRTKVSMPN